jgi:hypothetical protein
MKRTITMVSVFALVMMLALPALANTPSSPTSDGGVVPYIVDNPGPGGNVTCEQLGYELSSERVNYDDETGNFDADFPNGIDVTVTDDVFVEWSSGFPIGAVIVKGSNQANVYEYIPQALGDSGLSAPPNASGDPAGLSNLTFCWNPSHDECWQDETAWADGTRYTNRGNWATYTPYVAGSSVTLYAGQTMEAGTVAFGPVVDGMVEITITLNEGWRFNPEEDENVKIQDYAFAPSGNPNPGGFAHKAFADASPFTISVPANSFYGVHVDVEFRVACPVETDG